MSYTFKNYCLTMQISHKAARDVYLSYLVSEPAHNVVLKVFGAECLRAAVRPKDFQRVASTFKRLSHAHIVPVLDIEVENERPYVVSDYLPGGSLRQRLDQCAPGYLRCNEALHIAIHIGDAVRYAHSQGILHEKIKPEHIFLNTQGEALLAEFSVGEIINETALESTLDDRSISYMAPEQLVGWSSPLSDQYALGCLLYELITGALPFSVEDLRALRQHATRDVLPIAPSVRVPNLPKSLEVVILKALSKKPEQRYPDMAAFLNALRKVARPKPPKLPVAYIQPISDQNLSDAYDETVLAPFGSLPVTPDQGLALSANAFQFSPAESSYAQSLQTNVMFDNTLLESDFVAQTVSRSGYEEAAPNTGSYAVKQSSLFDTGALELYAGELEVASLDKQYLTMDPEMVAEEAQMEASMLDVPQVPFPRITFPLINEPLPVRDSYETRAMDPTEEVSSYTARLALLQEAYLNQTTHFFAADKDENVRPALPDPHATVQMSFIPALPVDGRKLLITMLACTCIAIIVVFATIFQSAIASVILHAPAVTPASVQGKPATPLAVISIMPTSRPTHHRPAPTATPRPTPTAIPQLLPTNTPIHPAQVATPRPTPTPKPTPTPIPVPNPNLLTNPTFQGLTGWSCTGVSAANGVLTMSDTGPGSCSQTLTLQTNTTYVFDVSVSGAYPQVTLSNGESYYLSGVLSGYQSLEESFSTGSTSSWTITLTAHGTGNGPTYCQSASVTLKV